MKKKPHAKLRTSKKKAVKPSRSRSKKSPANKNRSRTKAKGKRKVNPKRLAKNIKLDSRRKIQTKPKRKSVKTVRRKNSNQRTKRKDRGKSVSLVHNVLTIYLTGLVTFEEKINYIRDLDFSYQVERFIDQYEDKFPRAVMVVFESDGQYFANKMSPPEMNVDYDNVKKFVLDGMVEFQDSFLIEQVFNEGDQTFEQFDYNATFDPNLIERIRIRFFYA